jgi:hypothetical protein
MSDFSDAFPPSELPAAQLPAREFLPTACCLLPTIAVGARIAVAIAMLIALSALSVHAGTAAPEAKSELTPEELEAVKALFQKMANGFDHGDAHAVAILFVNQTSRRHVRISEGLEREFGEINYSDFTIVSVSPDETLNRKCHSVDVTMRRRIADRSKARAGANAAGNSNTGENEFATTTESFLVQKMDDGAFALIDSPFFDKLGLRQGIGIVVDAVLAIMGLVAALAFWVWMGFAVSWARPRSRFWRGLVYCVPIAGALVFFVVKYMPAQMGAPKVRDA